MRGSPAPPHVHPHQHTALVLLSGGGRAGSTGAACTGSPRPPADICRQSWDTWAMGGAPRNFPSVVPCVCGCCLPPRAASCYKSQHYSRNGGPQPTGSPCCTTGWRGEVLPWKAAELRWKEAAPLSKQAENGRQHSCCLLEVLVRCQTSLSSLVVQGPVVYLQTAWISSWAWWKDVMVMMTGTHSQRQIWIQTW